MVASATSLGFENGAMTWMAPDAMFMPDPVVVAASAPCVLRLDSEGFRFATTSGFTSPAPARL